jgi:CRISPR-associated protein Cas1
MIKRTLYFGNPAYLRYKDEQLVVTLPEAKSLPEKDGSAAIPVEDIGVIVLDHPQITISHYLLNHNPALWSLLMRSMLMS